jgi:hypothetical protein
VSSAARFKLTPHRPSRETIRYKSTVSDPVWSPSMPLVYKTPQKRWNAVRYQSSIDSDDDTESKTSVNADEVEVEHASPPRLSHRRLTYE